MRSKNKLVDKNIFFLFLIVLVIAVSVFFIVTQLKSDDYLVKMENNDYIAVLFNISDNENLVFSELLIIDNKTDKGALFNIPGNYGSIIESLSRIERLDILFNHKNPENMVKKIESITNLSIDYYVNIEMENLVRIVDLMSGLEMFIANPVEQAGSSNLLLLPSGSNVLDGEKIKIFLTANSDDENDSDLIGRWHKFIQGFIKKNGEILPYLQNKEIFGKYYSFFNTSMNRESFMTFMRQMKNINSERMILQRILGDKRVIDEQTLLFPYYNGNLLRETIKQTLSSIASEDVISGEEITVGIEIQNGTTVPGLAGRTAHFFTNLGYDVLSTKNADRNDYEKTVVIAISDNPATAQKVASIIRCNNIETRTVPPAPSITLDEEITYTRTHTVEVIIILGKDFDGRYCK